MQQIYFAGGESLIIEEHYEILEECIQKDMQKILNCVTTAMVLNGERIYLILGSILNWCVFITALTASENMNDYIRYS